MEGDAASPVNRRGNRRYHNGGGCTAILPMNVSDAKPWFRDDLARTLASLYFANKPKQTETLILFSAICLAFGINPENILSPEDVQKMKRGMQ